ncbi:hypothetical protein VTN77DRAFT_4197 [Rasamsonia byssochlamydoides]|uniref:uncharacterized protein n=1 Tax=Rasamsonia byssochlamydoides TaxID=89139 RepID=UPI003742FF8E
MSGNSDYHPSLDDPNVWVPYRYVPTKVGAAVFIVAFALTTILHCFQLLKHKTWYFIPLFIGGIFEIVGYIGRMRSAEDLWALGPYIMQSLLLLVAPALFSASIYIVLGRIILLVDGEQYALIPLKWLTKVFVCGDVLSFGLQCAGGGIQAIGTLSALNAGETIITVGLFVQLIFFGFFIVVGVTFHARLVKHRGGLPALHELPWKLHLNALYTGSALIMVRSIFRVVEYLMGNDGYLLKHEAFLYVFDATLMLLVMVLFNLVHPNEITRLYNKRNSNDILLLGQGEERNSDYLKVPSEP